MGATPVIGTLTQWVVRAIFPNPDQGAEAILYAATDAAPGSYSGPTGFRETRGPVGEAKLSPWAQDETLAGLLWERSEELTGVSRHALRSREPIRRSMSRHRGRLRP